MQKAPPPLRSRLQAEVSALRHLRGLAVFPVAEVAVASEPLDEACELLMVAYRTVWTCTDQEAHHVTHRFTESVLL